MPQGYKSNEESRAILAKYGISEGSAAGQSTGTRINEERERQAGAGAYSENDRSRRILAKYGLADYTDEEKNELAGWQKRLDDSQEWYNRALGQIEKTNWADWQGDADYRTQLDSRIQDVQSYLDSLSADSITYRDARSYLRGLQRMQRGFQDRADYYGQFQNEDEYGFYQDMQRSWNRAQALGKDRLAWSDEVQNGYRDASERAAALRLEVEKLETDIPQIEQELGYYQNADPAWQADLEQKRRRLGEARQELAIAQRQAARGAYQNRFAEAWRYSDLPEKEDWQSGVEAGRAAYEQLAQQIQQERDARAQEEAWGNVETAGMDQEREDYYTYRTPRENWDEDEKQKYYYLLQRDRDEAERYAVSLNTNKRYELRQGKMDQIQDWGGRNGFNMAVSWLGGIIGDAFAGFDYLGDAVQYANTGLIMPRTELSASDLGDAATAGAVEKLNSYGTLSDDWGILAGKGWGDLYQTAQSVGGSLAAAQMGGGVANILFFGSAAKHGTEDAMARGATEEQALGLGFLNGAAEVLGETLSVERLIKIRDTGTVRRALWNILTQAGIEASEEGFTTLMNTFADELVMGDKSELQQAIAKYQAQGMSKEEAQKQAFGEWCEDLLFDMAAGAFSGGIGAGIQMGTGAISNSRAEYTGEQQALLDLARSQGENSEAFRLAQELEEKGWMSRQDALRLEGTMSEDVVEHFHQQQTEQRRAEYRQQAEERLQDLGLTQEQIAPAAEAISRELTGEKVERGGRKAHQAALESTEARQTLYELREAQRQQQWAEAYQRAERAQERRQKRKGAPTVSSADTSPEGGSKKAALQPSTATGSAQLDSSVKVDGFDMKMDGLLRAENGELLAQVKDADGNTAAVPLEELDYGESGIGELVKELRGQPDAPAMFAAYFSGQDIGDFINGWNFAKTIGQRSSTATPESIRDSALLEGMDPRQVEAAFQYGRSLARQEREQRAKERAAEEKEKEEKSPRPGASTEAPPLRQGGQKKGGVSFEGGTVDGVKLKAVNRDRLSNKQRTQIEAVQMLSEATGIRFVFFESEAGKGGRLQGANGLYKDGTIYLDVNAGQHGQSIGQAAIVRTAAHELTHYIQDYAPEHYDELQSFLLDHLIEWKGKSLGDLAAAKIQRDRSGTLTMEQALDEVVADGCEMMLRRTKVMQTMAQENRGLFRIVKDWIQKWTKTIRDAFRGVSEVHEEARAVAEMETERLERFVELWDKGLIEAAERAQKSPAKEGGAVKWSLVGIREDGIEVYETSEETKALSWKERKKRFMDRLKTEYRDKKARFQRNGHTYYASFEDTDIQKNIYGDVESDLPGHGAKINAGADGDFIDLISNTKWFGGGKETGKTTKAHKGVLYWDYYVKTVQIDNKVYDLLANVRQRKDGSFVYNVELFERKDIEAASPRSSSEEKRSHGAPTASGNSILPSPENSNTKFQERDELPDDRELLMTVEARGKNAEALTAYQKKVKALEALQRKLGRQRETLTAGKEERKDNPSVADATAPLAQGSLTQLEEKIQKTEASILRAEKVLDEMERDPRIRQEAERALAEWREQNPNEAARALREMRREQESLRRYVELLREEAKLTTPETRTLLPSDVNKLARALVKEFGSDAAVDGISEKLQKLGDFMVSNLQGADTGYYVQMQKQARQIAEQIVESSYEVDDSQKEVREGIRSYLRGHTLRITEDLRGDIPDFDRWRKAHMGTLRLGNEGMDIDQAYQDLRAAFGEGYFPEDVTAHSDQLQQILDTLEAVQPSYHNMFGRFDSWRAEEALANEIINRLMSGEVRERETEADKAYRKRMQEMKRKYAQKDKARQQALEDAEDRAAWEARKRDEAEERRREERALRRQLVQEKVHELRERSIQRDKEYKKRISIEKKTVALSKIMLENSGKRHVPDAWKEAIGNFLSSIDTLTPQSGDKSRAFHLERIEGLQKMVQRQIAANQGLEAIGETEGGPQIFLDMNPYLAEMLEPYVRMARDSDTGRLTTVQMDLEQLTGLEEVLVALREAVDKCDKMLAEEEKAETLSGTAGKTVAYLEPMGKGTTGGMVRRFFQFDNLTPVYFFRRFGEAGEQIFRSLQKGWGKLAFHAREIIDFSESTYSSKEAKAWESEVHEFKLIKRESDLSGRTNLVKAAAEGGPEAVREAEEANKETVHMSTAQIMGLYCLAKREQARGHILSGGIRIWDIESKTGKIKKTQEQAERYLVKPEDLAAIVGTLTPRQKEVADKLQRYMNTVGSAWGNEVSQARFGVDLFTEANYYPIMTDPQSRNARNPEADGTDLFHILNMGFTKNTVKNAKNGIVLHSIFDVFANHMADMAKYNSMGLPMLDAMKWFNYRDETDGSFTSVRKAMETAYGKNAEKYFLGFIQDLNGSFEGGRRGEDLGQKMISMSKVASVGGNLRVAMLQPTSYVRALAVLDPKYLIAGDDPLKIKKGIQEAMKYSGTAVWKDLGFFDMNINANMRDLIKHTDSTVEKIREASMWGAEMGDKTTWGRLWNATKAETRAKTGLSGEALLRATAERFDDVIYRTQVMDSTMTRSHLMRQKGVYAGMVTSFMSEPTLSYNLVLDAVNSYLRESRTKGHGAAWKKAAPVMARAFAVYALSQIAASLVESIFDALRDDDDYENLWEKWKQAEFGWDGNLAQDLALHNKLPYIRDLISIAEGFTNKRMDTEWMDKVFRAGKAVKKALERDENGEIQGFTWGTAYTVLQAMSTMTGLPASNIVRDSIALWNGTVVQFVPDWKLKTVKTSEVKPAAGVKQAYLAGALSEEDAVRYLLRDAEVESEDRARQLLYEWGLEKGEKKYDALLAAVKAGDADAFQSQWDEMTDYGYSEKSLHSAVKSAVKEWYQGTGEDGGLRMGKQKAIDALVQYGGMRRREAEQTVQEWTSYVSSPEKLQYDEIKDAYLDGEISRERAEEMRALYGAKDEDEAAAEVNKWRCEKETGIPYSDVKNAYLDGEIDLKEATRIRMEYGGQSREDAEKEVNKWRCEKETGIVYDEIRDLYVRKEITAQQVRKMLTTYGGYSEDDAEGELLQYDFAGKNPELKDISKKAATDYYFDLAGLGIEKETWHAVWKAENALQSDKDENGKTVTDSKLKKVAAYIDGLNLTAAQKDALFLQFYKESKLWKTPWHN